MVKQRKPDAGERIDNTLVDAAKVRRWGLEWPRGLRETDHFTY